MALYDRTYMRDEYSSQGLSMILRIIIVTVVAFIVQALTGIHSGNHISTLERVLAFSGEAFFSGKIWTLFTYALLHARSNPLHLIFNMLIVYMAGRVVEQQIGSRKTLYLYLLSTLTGCLFYFGLHMFVGNIGYLLGASAAGLGLLTAFCMLNPNQPITILIFFVVPVTMRPSQLLVGLFLLEFVGIFSELGGYVDVASSAHLGGMLGAWIFMKIQKSEPIIPKTKMAKQMMETPSWIKKAGSQQKAKFKINITNRGELKKEVDRILDKINESGFGSLSEEERKTLDKAKDILSK